MIVLVSRIRIEEDIINFFPDDDETKDLNFIYRNSSIGERTTIMVSLNDSTIAAEPDSLVSFAEMLTEGIRDSMSGFIKKMTGRVDEELLFDIFQSVTDYLPSFLEESDYLWLDSLSDNSFTQSSLQNSFDQLLSPSGIVAKKIITEDPVGISFRVLSKLSRLQFDENFELYDGYIITRDHRNILLFLQGNIPVSDTKRNTVFVNRLEEIIRHNNIKSQTVNASAFGASIVGVGNAVQIHEDSKLTLSIMVVLMALLIIGYFRKPLAPLLILFPALFGGLFSLALISVLKGSISIIAIGAGSVILGIAINYSLHLLTHLKFSRDKEVVIADLSFPLTIGSATTVLAFLSLQFTSSSILRDIGLFAGLSLIGAAFSSIAILPLLIPTHFLHKRENERTGWIDRISFRALKNNKYLLVLIIVGTVVFSFFAGNVQFNEDMNSLNYMTPELRASEKKLERLNEASLGSLFVISEGKNLEQALKKNESYQQEIDRLKQSGEVVKSVAISSFLLSDSLQYARIEKWNNYWAGERKEKFISVVSAECKKIGFSDVVIDNFRKLLFHHYVPTPTEMKRNIQKAFFDDFIIEKEGRSMVITPVSIASTQRENVKSSLKKSGIGVFDRQSLANIFIKSTSNDFTIIVNMTAVIVFISMLFAYGRIELTLISFLPMFLSWIWTLGVMALLNIEFNIVNVMVSTFIFGLGDDFSISTMDGLRKEYHLGKKLIPAVRASIILSVLTASAGLGVLIFAKHPAMRSIASISLIGIVSVFFMSQVLVPILFQRLITTRTHNGLPPITFLGIIRTILTYSFFVTGAMLLTIAGLILRILPLKKEKRQFALTRSLKVFAQTQIYMDPFIKKRAKECLKENFSEPSIIIANHSSYLDILLCIMLSPKIVMITNKWVSRSPLFGGVVRLAGYKILKDNLEENITYLRETIDNGYSIVIFPEGTRSMDGRIHRFHKGAFYLAEQLCVPVRPLMIHGAYHCASKGTFYLCPGTLSMKMPCTIYPEDIQYGTSYSERAKKISLYFKNEYNIFKRDCESKSYFAPILLSGYLYKGPVLEWYLRIKMRLEGYYEFFHQHIPSNAAILDLGCGYGFLSYILALRAPERKITAIDHDEEKIGTATHSFLKSDNVTFLCRDVLTVEYKSYDVIIIADVLHYLLPEQQDELLIRCFGMLNTGGRMIVRDGDAEQAKKRHSTRFIEFMSIRLLGFNKTINSISLVNKGHLLSLAEKHRMKILLHNSSAFISSDVFIFTKIG
ncbi:MAG: 1-acyl-sn-glycerol-3-phosphate acyltransferase [Crocinitomicaceae bacterium]|nr:1-acyl-sn-glycerol-3-phosphate acyltransferase [Crocinitomicaceae bacterium]